MDAAVDVIDTPQKITAHFDEPAEFLYHTLSASSLNLRQYITTFQRVLQHYRVIPWGNTTSTSLNHAYPYLDGGESLLGRIMLKDPESFQIITTLAANYYLQLFGDDQLVRVAGGTRDAIAADQAGTLAWFFHKRGIPRALYKMLISTVMYGFGWGDTRLKRYRKLRYGDEQPLTFLDEASQGAGLEMPVIPGFSTPFPGAPGMGGPPPGGQPLGGPPGLPGFGGGSPLPPPPPPLEEMSPAEEADFARRLVTIIEPHLESVSPFRVYPDWSKSFGKEMDFAIRHMQTTEDALIDAADRDPEGYIVANIEEALDRNGDKRYHGSDMGEVWREMLVDGLGPEDFKAAAGFRPLDLLEYRGKNPFYNPAKDDPEWEFCVIETVNGVTVRYDVSGYDSGHTLRVIMANEFNERPFGMGAGEVIQYQQDRIDGVQALGMEAEIRLVRTPILVGLDGTAALYRDELEMAPSGQSIAVKSVDQIAPLKMDLSPWFLAMQQRAGEKQGMRQSVGALDALQGIPSSSGGGTATEAVRIEQYANMKIDAQIDIIENDHLPVIAEDILQNAIMAWRGAEDPDGELSKRLGRSASLANLREDRSIRFLGSKRFRATFGIGRLIDQAVQMAQVFPQLQHEVNFPKLLAFAFRQISPDFTEEFMMTPREQALSIAKATLMAQVMGSAGGGGPSAAKPPAPGSEGKGQPSPPRPAATAGGAVPPRLST